MDPVTGRFISEDPARDGLNWFVYGASNPINRVDPDGKASVLVDLFSAVLIAGGLLLITDNVVQGGLAKMIASFRSAGTFLAGSGEAGRRVLEACQEEGVAGDVQAKWAIKYALTTVATAATSLVPVLCFPGGPKLAKTILGTTMVAAGVMLWME
jgi:hypothetical protein